jgi:hypothetical protein
LGRNSGNFFLKKSKEKGKKIQKNSPNFQNHKIEKKREPCLKVGATVHAFFWCY